MAKRRVPLLRIFVILGAITFATLAYVYLTLPDVRALAKTNPSTTAFMELRAAEAAREGKRTPRPAMGPVFPSLPAPEAGGSGGGGRRILGSRGIDLEQIRESMRVNWEQGRAARGASTITQQLAKNLYLTPSRSPLRKLRELIIARRLEAALPKARIFEIYLNVIEWGDGIWGAEAAARTYFAFRHPPSMPNRLRSRGRHHQPARVEPVTSQHTIVSSSEADSEPWRSDAPTPRLSFRGPSLRHQTSRSNPSTRLPPEKNRSRKRSRSSHPHRRVAHLNHSHSQPFVTTSRNCRALTCSVRTIAKNDKLLSEVRESRPITL